MSNIPTPWHWIAQASTADRFELICLNRDELGFVGSIIAKDMVHDDAKFVKTAVNNYQILVDALKEIAYGKQHTGIIPCPQDYEFYIRPWRAIARKALEELEQE
jgi:hypothetical protein